MFEQNAAAREKLMVSLLASFDARTWVSISGIILRLVKGGGFGQARLSKSCSCLLATQPETMLMPTALVAVLPPEHSCWPAERFAYADIFTIFVNSLVWKALPVTCCADPPAAAGNSDRGLLAALPLAAAGRVSAKRPGL